MTHAVLLRVEPPRCGLHRGSAADLSAPDYGAPDSGHLPIDHLSYVVVLSSCDHHRRPAGDSLNPADCAKTFSTSTGHHHQTPTRLPQQALHVIAMWRDLRPFAHECRRGIPDRPSERTNLTSRDPQQCQRVSPFPLRIRIGKPLPDIAEPGSCEQRISDRMRRHISVGMTSERALIGKAHPAQHQNPIGIIDKSMDIETLTNANLVNAGHRATSLRAHSRSSGVVIFRFRTDPSTTITVPPIDSTSAASSVADFDAAAA